MDRFEADMPLEDPDKFIPEAERTGFAVGYDVAKLSYGGNLEEETYKSITNGFKDYTDNKDAYDAWMNVEGVFGDSFNRARHERATEDGTFMLGANNNVLLGENGIKGTEILFDMNAIKGALLAKKNGYTEKTFNNKYSELAKEQINKLAKDKEGTSTAGYIGGILAGHIVQPELIQEIATSPAKIMGKTILGGMGKAFMVEGAVGFVGEISREQRISEHMERANLEYTLWDSVQQIVIGTGLAGGFRAIGSGVTDVYKLRKIRKEIPNATDRDIFTEYMKREDYKLVENTDTHIALMNKAEDDMNNGRAVDISDHTDIDISTKTDDAVEEVSLSNELTLRDDANGYPEQVTRFEDEFQAPEIKTDSKYAGMADDAEGDAKIKDMSEFDPEIKAEMEAIKAELAQPIKEPIVKEVSPQVAEITTNITERAKALQGNKYVWGGTDLKSGADCSGFVQSIHKEQGINLPRTAWGQAKGTQGKNIAFDDMQIGDTIYFKPSTTGKKYAPVTHTGIITDIKNGKYIMTHAKGKKYGTVTEELSPGYIDRFYSAKRFTEEGGERVAEAPTPKEGKVIIDEEITPEMEQTLLKQEELDTIEFNKMEEIEVPTITEDEIPKRSKRSEAAKARVAAKREQLEKEFGADEDKIREGMRVKKKRIKKDTEYKGMTKAELARIDAQNEADMLSTAEYIKKAENKQEAFNELPHEVQIETLKRLDDKTLSEVMPFTKPETIGALYGFEQDEDGYWTYNVAKGALGALGIYAARRTFTSKTMKNWVIKKLDEIEEEIKKGGGGGTPPEKIYTEKQLEQMPIEELDKLAFGVNDGDIIKMKPKDINLIYSDIENAEYKFEKGGMKWVRSVDLTEPVNVSVDDAGKFNLEDGHHRYFAAKKLGKELNVEIELKGNPIRKLLKEQK